MTTTIWPAGSDPRDLARSAGALAHGKMLLRAGAAPVQRIGSAPHGRALVKAVERTVADDCLRAAGSGRLTPARADLLRRSAAVLELAEQAEDARNPWVAMMLRKAAERAADGMSAPAGRGPPRTNYPYVSQGLDDDRTPTEPHADASVFDWESVIKNPDFDVANDARALSLEFTGANHALNTSGLSGASRQSAFQSATFVSLRRLINRMESVHGFDVTPLYRQLGVKPPKPSEGHADDESGGQDFGPQHQFTRPGFGDLSWHPDDGISDRSRSSMTEGEVPQYAADEPYKSALARWRKRLGHAPTTYEIKKFLEGYREAQTGLTRAATSVAKSMDTALMHKHELGDSLFRDYIQMRTNLHDARNRRDWLRSREYQQVIERLEGAPLTAEARGELIEDLRRATM